jgi:hypothetical protein
MSNELRIEVRPIEDYDFKSDRLVAHTQQNFEALGAAIADATNRFWSALQARLKQQPAEVEMEVHVGFDLGGNWYVVSGKHKANATVKLVWK